LGNGATFFWYKSVDSLYWYHFPGEGGVFVECDENNLFYPDIPLDFCELFLYNEVKL